MIAWINTDEDGRITASTTFEEYSKGMMKVDIPDDFDFLKLCKTRHVLVR